MNPLLEIVDLAVSFRTSNGLIRAVDGVSFSIAEREILGIVGESGSGKSLTVLAILDLIGDPNAVVTGSIRFRGIELIGQKPETLRRLRGGAIAMIFQDPMTALTPVFTIGAQISEQIRIHTDLSRHAAQARAVELLDAVGLPDPHRAAARYPQELSGGQRQRAVIAMALSCNPALLLADEPTTALDVTVQAQILELIRKLRDDFNSAVILITHNLGVVAETADRVAVMYSGRIVETADTGALFADPHHPYTWGLLGSMPALDGIRRPRLTTIPGLPPALDRRPQGCAFSPRCGFVRPECLPAPPCLTGTMHQAACVIADHERAAARNQVLAA
ncbi:MULTISPECIES: ABC transporter ATP-binding protein [Acidiphilium]|uniref:Peptide/nickel transport system ATP-binding protein n=1 Tax=Acidiphilium rubrum TaxID=526 RepID=A0A8G2CJX6_ACIRU|nr:MULTISPECIES: ABC transporter ATP-binding protein [Acidiphilium]SIQ33494.1 peptide/nickel transport system ATP-binding protein [Acidiphilium rubrum]